MFAGLTFVTADQFVRDNFGWPRCLGNNLKKRDGQYGCAGPSNLGKGSALEPADVGHRSGKMPIEFVCQAADDAQNAD